MILGTNLKTLRRRKNKTVEELSEELSFDIRTLESWEKYETVPNMDQLVKLSKYYEIGLDNLLFKELSNDNQLTIQIEHKSEEEVKTITVQIKNHKL